MSLSAQNLPELVVDRVLDYLVCSDLVPFILPSKQTLYERIRPLSQLCSSWRDVAIARFFENADMCLEGKSSIHLAIALRSCAKVKDATLTFNTGGIFDGTVMAGLRLEPFRDCIFPSAVRLLIRFQGPLPVEDAETRLLANNILGFLDEFRRLFPAATDIHIQHKWKPVNEIWPASAVDLLSGALSNATSVTCLDLWLSAIPGLIAADSCLESIDAYIGSPSSLLVEVVRRSAPTLWLLRLQFDDPSVCSRLVTAEDGTLFEYPQLRTLDLYASSTGSPLANGHRISPDSTPFPNLEILFFCTPYPFGNDILLRGNGHSLRVLDMNVSSELLDIFVQSNVFDQQRFTALDYLRLENRQGERAKIEERHIPYIFSLFQQVSVAGLFGCVDFGFEIGRPHLGDSTRNIRVLDIPQLGCTFEQFILLIKGLPFLHKLSVTCLRSAALKSVADSTHSTCGRRCQVGSAANDIADQSNDPEQVYFDRHLEIACQTMGFAGLSVAAGPPISKRLLAIEIRLKRATMRMQAIRLFVILAMVCPSLQSFGYYTRSLETSIERSRIISAKAFQDLELQVMLGNSDVSAQQ